MRSYTLALTALDEKAATFGVKGAPSAAVLPRSIWEDDGRPTTLHMTVETPAERVRGGAPERQNGSRNG